MTHVMIDLETLGTSPGCAIVSIGACSFSREGIDKVLYERIDVSDTRMRIDPGTSCWWMRQSDAARSVFNPGGFHAPAVLTIFSDWFHAVAGEQIWGHGASFDAPILAAAYEFYELPCPFKFWNMRDTRTIYELAGVSPDRTAGTHHNALDDAKAQAEAVIKAWKVLGQ